MNGYSFTKMPIETLINPDKEGYYWHMLNHYWPITDDDCVLFYGSTRSPYSSPQCNRNQVIAERFRDLEKKFHIKDVILIPIAFAPIRIADYQE